MAAPETPWLTRYLEGRDIACPLCQCPIRDLVGDTCPRCNAELLLSIGTVEPHLRAWIALAVATCAASGVGIFLIAVLLDEGPPPPRMRVLYWSVWYLVACTPLGPIVVVARRPFLRLQPSTQRRLATIGIAAVLLGVLAFTWGMKVR